MSRNNRISCVEQADGSIDTVVPAGMAETFRHLVVRATNTWQDQHVEIRDFTDRILKRDHIVGKCMKWELPSEDAYEVVQEQQKRLALDNITPALEPIGKKVQVQVPVPSDSTLAKRSCCGTLLREPHHTQCTERWSQATPLQPRTKSA